MKTTASAVLRPPVPLSRGLSPVQASALRRHLQQCREAHGRFFGAAMLAERAHAVVAPRFVTTVSVLAMTVALAFGWA